MVADWVKQMTEEVIGGSPVHIGGRYIHPDGGRYIHPEDGLIEITSGQYWGTHGLSNHWRWTVVETGETHAGYGGDWPKASDG